MNNSIQILGIVEKLNEWNDKLNAYFSESGDSIWVGVAIMGALLLVAAWGIRTLNK